MRHEREYFRAVRAFLRAPEVPGVIAKKSYSAVRPPFTESTTRVPSGRSPLTTPDTFPSIERCFSPRRKSTILQANPFRTRHDLRARVPRKVAKCLENARDSLPLQTIIARNILATSNVTIFEAVRTCYDRCRIDLVKLFEKVIDAFRTVNDGNATLALKFN